MKDHDMNDSHYKSFLSEKEIEQIFGKKAAKTRGTGSKPSFSDWYKGNHHDHPFTYGHMERIGSSHYICDTIVDEWYNWRMTSVIEDSSSITMPAYNTQNTVLMGKEGARVYFATVSPFKEPNDFKTIIMTRKAPLLIPVYNMVASAQEYPSQASRLKSMVEEDLKGIEELEAILDGEPFYGCAVMRKEPLLIRNIPNNNILGIPTDRLQANDSTIEIYHGGFWLLIREGKLPPGDHLLELKAYSANYQMHSKIFIRVLY